MGAGDEGKDWRPLNIITVTGQDLLVDYTWEVEEDFSSLYRLGGVQEERKIVKDEKFICLL